MQYHVCRDYEGHYKRPHLNYYFAYIDINVIPLTYIQSMLNTFYEHQLLLEPFH